MGLLDGARSAVRYLSRTTGALAADVGNAASRTGEVLAGAVTGSVSSPGTVRLSVLVLSDEQGVPLAHPDELTASIDRADTILRAEANLRVRHVATHVVAEPAPTDALNPRANKLLLLDEVIGRTAFYHEQLAAYPDTSGALDVVGRPLTAIVVREIEGRTTGCSLGVSADWVVVQAGLFKPQHTTEYDETVLAHEIGHALNLPHHPRRTNLMYYASSPPDDLRGTELSRWQRAVMNANRHVLPGVRS